MENLDNQTRYLRLVQFLTDYIYTVKIINGKVESTYHGPGCYNITGYLSEEYDKNSELWYSMVYPDDKQKVLEQAQKALSGEDVAPLEHRLIHKNGNIKWVKNSIVLSKDEKGNVIYYDGLINDITEIKRAEEIAEIKQKQLIQADKMVSLGILTSGVAHEINNPNNFIILNIQILTKIWRDIIPILNEYYDENGDFILGGMQFSYAQKKLEMSMDAIRNGAIRIQKIVQSLTNFAKKSDDNFTQIINVNKVVENAILITDSLIKKSTENFLVNYNPTLPEIKGNPQQLEQVIINLINNACQSLADRTKRIEISLIFNFSLNSIEIIVSDEGIGISKEDQEHIFDPFFTTKRDYGGTGLGLYISTNIIKRHGGEIQLENNSPNGSIFKVILPIFELNGSVE